MLRCFRFVLSAVTVGLLLTTATVWACSIPVFRYALERWRPDPFEVLVFHRGELTDAEADLVRRFAPDAVPGEPVANVAVSSINLDGLVRPEFQAIWDDDPAESTPWIVVRTPWKGENFTVWQGPLAAESVETVLKSPVRMELIKRLAAGDSIVWLLLEGDDPRQTAQLKSDLTKQLQDLQTAISLPQIDTADLKDLSVSPDQLGLKFSILTLRRTVPQEQLLVRTLLTVQPGLDALELANQPMLFPVFGRCRVYFPLVGTAIEPANLEDMARFLSGACQCTIKQQNPGVDLLTMVDWDAYVLGIETEKPLPPLTGLGDFVSPDQATSAEALAEESATVTIDPLARVPVLGHESDSTTSPARDQPTDASTAMAAEPAAEADAPTRLTAERPAAATPQSSSEQLTSLGARVVWIMGGLTLAVAIASLWLLSGGSK